MASVDVSPLVSLRTEVGPLQEILASISNKWVATVFDLLTGTTELSYGELHRRSKGASRKMLSATLRDLVRDGLVQRRPETGSVPNRVYYRLSELGRSLVATLDGLREWADNHMELIDEARRTYYAPAEPRSR
ncbi:winged helix-turn-helix transcriptional regulator [Mycobacterium vicinigordonae]|uniref:Helix-turn-helix transcriptional regulator n=1 Tax=Mycobacterium vicinigordonae TaxID=1719132 RepID=A0A7D6HLL0_9MYCO|nr:helix-turn-helix domain-containing protein [Mycobacterium vicinigordonae]QLL05351.1 helix-turn-helix transcriptional regulator [Mycobacterium vicinigordonae]